MNAWRTLLHCSAHFSNRSPSQRTSEASSEEDLYRQNMDSSNKRRHDNTKRPIRLLRRVDIQPVPVDKESVGEDDDADRMGWLQTAVSAAPYNAVRNALQTAALFQPKPAMDEVQEVRKLVDALTLVRFVWLYDNFLMTDLNLSVFFPHSSTIFGSTARGLCENNSLSEGSTEGNKGFP